MQKFNVVQNAEEGDGRKYRSLTWSKMQKKGMVGNAEV